jgi:phosphoribosylamine--glycine ligase
MKAKIMLIGGGGREDAIARKIVENEGTLISVMPFENPSIKRLCNKFFIAGENDAEKIISLAREEKPDVVYVSPDSFLEKPIVDALQYSNIKVASPDTKAFQIESSKIFMRQLLKRFGIQGNLKYEIFYDEYDAGKFLDSQSNKEFAIKPAGLTGGKGVKLTDVHFRNRDEAKKYAASIISRDKKVIFEEKVTGEEFSLQAFTDGMNVSFFPLAQDYKRLMDDETGPNTGGMGSITGKEMLLPFIRRDNVEKAKDIVKKVIESLYSEGTMFKGVIYGQFMQTTSGVKVIEFNGRMADPEGINCMALYDGDLVETLLSLGNGNLKTSSIHFQNKASVLKYIVAEGYPDNPAPGKLKVNNKDLPEHFKIYYSSVKGSMEEPEMTGSRSLALLGIGETIEEASGIVETNLWRISGKYYMRHGIGTAASLKKKHS